MLGKNKFVAFHTDKFFAPTITGRRQQVHRHGVEQFVGKMNPDERFEIGRRSSPLHAIREFDERLRLSILQNGKRFDDPITQGFEEFRPTFARGFEHVARKLAVMRALFDNDEIVDLAEPFPCLGKLCREQLPEERADADVCKIIAAPTNGGTAGRVIPVFGVIKRLLHKPGERDRSARVNGIANEFDEFRLQPENVQRQTPNVQ